MTRMGMTPHDIFTAMIQHAPKVDITAVDVPTTMGKYFDPAGALIPGAGPKLAAGIPPCSLFHHSPSST